MKLVRDYIPEIIEQDGKWCLTRRVHGLDEHLVLLKEKIIEESQEFIEDPRYEDAADMLEVVRAFCALYDLEFDIVIDTADNKQQERGGFTKGIILQEVK